MAEENQDAIGTAQMERWTVPGVAVGVLRGGERDLQAWGITSLETQQPTRPDTLFQIGSISKVFCATLVMTLVDEGKVDLDTPLSTYLPDLTLADEEAHRSVTLRQVLSHTSGIYGDYFDDFGLGDDALAKSVATVSTLRQWTRPGASWAYCNVGFNLAGAIVERVLDEPFEVAMRTRVFEPLGLDHSFYFAHEAIVHSVAVGHNLVEPGKDEHEVARKYPLPRCVNPAGGIISNVNDLLSFAAFHMSDRTVDGTQVLSPESIRTMQEPQTKAANFADEWGVGWDISWVDGVKVIGHGGTTNGFQARLAVVPDRQFAIAILTNSRRGAALNDRVEAWALEHELGLHKAPPEIISLSDDVLAKVAGEYKQPQVEFTATVENGGLRLDSVGINPLTDERTSPPPLTLAPISEREFVVTAGESEGRRIDFFGGEGDTPRFIRVHGRLAERANE
jgi:CubicO group peptidase (beta-lactamase class C family)